MVVTSKQQLQVDVASAKQAVAASTLLDPQGAAVVVGALDAVSAAAISPQAAAMARLQAAMASKGATGATAINLGKLQAGRAYTLRELASAVGFTAPVRQGKPRFGTLRRQLRNAVAQGKLVSATTGGYTNATTGNTAGGKAFYMLVD